MEALHKIGGVPSVIKYLLQKGLLHGECLTVTGKTLAENVADAKDIDFQNQNIILPLEKPIKKTGHLQILYGNLAEKGSVAKITGKEGERFKGTARVFNGEFELVNGIQSGRIKEGDVVVIRYVGPKGAPGMPEMLKPTSLIMGSGLGKSVALITDGRFSGGSHGFVIGHITPEAFDGGLLALVEDGDWIEIDVKKHQINLLVDEKTLAIRRSQHTPMPSRVSNGVLYKYAKQVKTAAEGCVTDEE
jgi:dihydroxy-acid dehydratase